MPFISDLGALVPFTAPFLVPAFLILSYHFLDFEMAARNDGRLIRRARGAPNNGPTYELRRANTLHLGLSDAVCIYTDAAMLLNLGAPERYQRDWHYFAGPAALAAFNAMNGGLMGPGLAQHCPGEFYISNYFLYRVENCWSIQA